MLIRTSWRGTGQDMGRQACRLSERYGPLGRSWEFFGVSEKLKSATGLADLLIDARLRGEKLAADAIGNLVPADAAAADAAQLAVAAKLGPIGGYKVLQVGNDPGS